MLVLLAGIFVVHIATVIMLFVSTIANVWVVSDFGQASAGLWKNCTGGHCDGTLPYADEGICKDIVFCADALCDWGTVQPVGECLA